MARRKALYNVQDARGMRGILSRGPAGYGPHAVPGLETFIMSKRQLRGA